MSLCWSKNKSISEKNNRYGVKVGRVHKECCHSGFAGMSIERGLKIFWETHRGCHKDIHEISCATSVFGIFQTVRKVFSLPWELASHLHWKFNCSSFKIGSAEFVWSKWCLWLNLFCFCNSQIKRHKRSWKYTSVHEVREYYTIAQDCKLVGNEIQICLLDMQYLLLST